MKIGVVGAGALGLTFAAALSSANDVVLLARRRSVAELIAREGAGIARDDGIEHFRVRITVDPHEMADRDALLVAVKAHATGEALGALRGVLGPHALVASVQNGIENVADA